MGAEALACVRLLRGRGHPCFPGTNPERYRAACVGNEMGLADHFDEIYASSALGHAKPSGEFFQAATDRIGSGDVFLVDDTIANGHAAKAFGWKALHYRDPRDLP